MTLQATGFSNVMRNFSHELKIDIRPEPDTETEHVNLITIENRAGERFEMKYIVPKNKSTAINNY